MKCGQFEHHLLRLGQSHDRHPILLSAIDPINIHGKNQSFRFLPINSWALGVGIGIGVPTFLIAVASLYYTKGAGEEVVSYYNYDTDQWSNYNKKQGSD
jgi:hypothetical protein